MGRPSFPLHRSMVVSVVAVTTSVAVHFSRFDDGKAYAVTGPTVSSVITTPDRTQLLSPGPNVAFDSVAPMPPNLIIVNPNQVFQTMDGFGASITDSSAALLYRLPQAQRDGVMNSIFHPVNGIGMSFLRQPIGASDFVDEPFYTYNDGAQDLSQTRFSIAHDNAQILPLLRQARILNPQLKVMGSPWSAPAWMKTNNSLIGGRMREEPAIFQSYALYLTKFVQAYEAAGVPIYAITVQNEPQNRTPDNYPGTDMPVAHQNAIIGYLGPMLATNGLDRVKIVSFDHNWSLHPDDLADANAMGVPPEPDYPFDALRAAAAQYIAGTGFHHYAGSASRQSALHNAFPDKDIWLTEASGWRGAADSPEKVFSDTFNWHARNVCIASIRNWAKAVVNWNLALDPQGGPVRGGCGSDPSAGACTGVITIAGTNVTRNAEYYVIGHFSKYVKPGAVRIGSNNVGELENVAFRNPDGSFAVIVKNVGGGTQSFGIAWNGMRANFSIAPNALMTVTWTGSIADTAPPTVPTNLTSSSTTSSSTMLSWGASTDNVGVAGYNIYRNGALAYVANGTGTSFTADGLMASTTYSFYVRARDAAGNLSGSSNTISVTTAAAPSIDTSRWYQVINTNSNKCVDAQNWGTGNGTIVHQWSCVAGAANQQWQLRSAGGGYYYVVPRHVPALGWDVSGGTGSTGDGPNVHLWAYLGAANQQWQPVLRSDGNYRFVARHSGKCLDVRDVSTADGAWLQQWTCTGGPAQSFRLVPADGAGVVFYEHIDFGGAASTPKPKGDYPVLPPDIPNDWMSSLRVPAGWIVEAFEHGGFGGAVCTYTADTAWVGSSCNDRMSSFRIR